MGSLTRQIKLRGSIPVVTEKYSNANWHIDVALTYLKKAQSEVEQAEDYANEEENTPAKGAALNKLGPMIDNLIRFAKNAKKK